MVLSENFAYSGTSQNFDRDSYATLAEMKAVKTKKMPSIFHATCEETGKLYIYNKTNTDDEILGKWREVGSGSISGELGSSAEAPVKVTDGKISLDTVPITKGGTGVTTQEDINKAFINNLEIDNSDVTDETEFVSSYASDKGFADPSGLNKPYKRQFIKVWNYIKDKISSVLGLTSAKVSSYDSHLSNKDNPHSVTKSQVGLGSVVNTGDSATPVSGGTTKFTTGGAYTELNKKVDKVDGKGLSSNDFTNTYKDKLDNTDTAVTTDSSNLVTSGAVATAISTEVTNRNTAITNAINNLDVSSVGGDGKYISAISETDGKISATSTTMDTAPTTNSVKAVTSGGIKTAISTAETNAKNLANATGTLPVANGGTGAITAKGAQKSLLSDMQTETTEMDDTTEFVMKYGTPTDTKGALFKRSATLVWNYIKGKISSVLGLTATNYGGKAATAGTADTATACSGNAATATKAMQDSTGQQINKTYIKELSISGKTITYTKGDKTTGILTTQDTTYSAATQSSAGLMSAADKTKLDEITANANKITVDSALSSTSTNPVQNKAINTALGNKVDKVSGKGLSTNDFTSTYKTKLDGIAEGANNYALPTANNSTLGGVKTTSTVTSTSGLTACPIINGVPYYKDTNTVYTHPTTEGNKHIPSGGSSGQILRWSSAGTAVWGNDNNTTYSNATTTTSGLMSAADKKKLDDLEKYTKEYKVSAVTADKIKYIKLGEFNPIEGGNINCRITGDNFDDTIDINILGGNFTNTSVSGYYSTKSKRTLGIRISGTVSNNIGIYIKINQLTTATVKVAVDKKYQSRISLSESGLGQYEGVLTDIFFNSYNGIFSSNAGIANNLSAGSLTTGKIQAENRGIVSLNSDGGMVIVNSTNNTTGGLRVKQKMVIPIGEPSDLENGCIWVG